MDQAFLYKITPSASYKIHYVYVKMEKRQLPMTHHAGTISAQHDILFELANEDRYDRILAFSPFDMGESRYERCPGGCSQATAVAFPLYSTGEAE